MNVRTRNEAIYRKDDDHDLNLMSAELSSRRTALSFQCVIHLRQQMMKAQITTEHAEIMGHTEGSS
jgi:hypothetical protein